MDFKQSTWQNSLQSKDDVIFKCKVRSSKLRSHLEVKCQNPCPKHNFSIPEQILKLFGRYIKSHQLTSRTPDQGP